MTRHILPIGIAITVVAGLSIAAWAIFQRQIPVHVAAVEKDVPVQVFGLGTVEARIASRIGFKVSGVLVDIGADVGDRVAKGSVLARLDDREQGARVARAKAGAEQAEATLQKAMASVQKAQANFANAKSIADRRQQLMQSASGSVEAAETAKAAREAAAADVSLATSDVALARASIADAKAQLQQETATLDFHTLNAPYNAMVTARLKELGAALGAGEPVFALIDPATIWVLAYIDESKAGEIAVGQPAEIVLRSRPAQRLTGRVARIEPESDRVNEERRVAVAFDNIPAQFNLGEQAEVYITTKHLKQAVLVPEAAIAGLNKNQGTVWTVEAGHLRQHPVRLGHRLLDGRFEITSGVPEGARVVTHLRNDMHVGRAARFVEGAP